MLNRPTQIAAIVFESSITASVVEFDRAINHIVVEPSDPLDIEMQLTYFNIILVTLIDY